MKKSLIIIAMALLSSAAFASDKAGYPCPTDGWVSRQIGGEVLSCVDSKWKLSHVGTTQITMSIQLLEGIRRHISTQVMTLDNQPTPISISFVDGELSMVLTPTLIQGDKILVDLAANKSEIHPLKPGEMPFSSSQMNQFYIRQMVALKIGEEVAIPFGPQVMPPEGTSIPMPSHAQYTLKLVATKL